MRPGTMPGKCGIDVLAFKRPTTAVGRFLRLHLYADRNYCKTGGFSGNNEAGGTPHARV